jgi:hypothetical protein
MGFLSYRAQGTLTVNDLRGMFAPRASTPLERSLFFFKHVRNIANKDLTTFALLSGQSVGSYGEYY